MSYQILQPRVKNQTPANLMVLLRRLHPYGDKKVCIAPT